MNPVTRRIVRRARRGGGKPPIVQQLDSFPFDDLPELVMRQVLGYFSWPDRIRFERTCRKWLCLLRTLRSTMRVDQFLTLLMMPLDNKDTEDKVEIKLAYSYHRNVTLSVESDNGDTMVENVRRILRQVPAARVRFSRLTLGRDFMQRMRYSMSTIRKLEISCCSTKDMQYTANDWRAVWCKMTRLCSLEVTGLETDSLDSMLGPLVETRPLQMLRLNCSPRITDKTLRALANNCSRLKTFESDRSEISIDTAEFLIKKLLETDPLPGGKRRSLDFGVCAFPIRQLVDRFENRLKPVHNEHLIGNGGEDQRLGELANENIIVRFDTD